MKPEAALKSDPKAVKYDCSVHHPYFLQLIVNPIFPPYFPTLEQKQNRDTAKTVTGEGWVNTT